MPEASAPTALYRLYSTHQLEGLPAAIDGLHPERLHSWHYLGTAGSCPNGGPGISYRPFDFESDNCVALERVVRWGAPEAPVPTALYRLCDRVGRLLYVGVTDNPDRRWPQHAADKAWWPTVTDLSIKWYPSRDCALTAEADAIRAEHPVHNVQHNDQKP
ncbi:GIY-YIG nuclease family protein [Streptomyces sp. NPDC059994]|uniref:GIY-YIG nuclease family protein n=1 Tax=Streptomyces sp. NPDC059994 TaxID=3347029 RepID=UPI0036CB15BB